MLYNQQLYTAFRALAVTNVNDLEVGKTYWSNGTDEFTVEKLLTDKEQRIEWLKLTEFDIGIDDSDDIDIRWIGTTNGRWLSTQDNNIGESYNPWLIFDNEALATACREKLIITYADYRDDDYYFPDYED